MAYQVGDRVGDYQIVDVLGAGGMGKVYKVRNTISDRVEAMKVLLPNLESDPELADRFMREIKVQASLDHPNIAGLHTALRINNQLIMLIEFVEGRTIEAELRNGHIPVAKAVDYIRQVLAALGYAHARGVVHRDIKPANMMLTPGGVVKLMDFGIARMTADRKLTQTGRTVGSLFYMSPEQIQGAVDLDGRSDLYSVGVSLYEMCTNRRPFQGDSDYSIMAAHLNSAPVPPIELDPSLPAALNEIILMSIGKDPSQRFQTAEAFRLALNSVTGESQAVPTIPMGSATRIGSGAVRPAAPVGPLQGPPPLMSESLANPKAASATPIQPGSNRRALYMAIGSVATIAVLAVAALQAPKFFRSSSADTGTPAMSEPATIPSQSTPPQQPASEEPASQQPVAQQPSMPEPSASRPVQNEPKMSAQVRPQQPAASAISTPPAQVPAQQTQASQTQPQAAAPQPPQNAPAPQTPPAQVPAVATVNAQELEDLQDRMILLATRANSIRGSLDAMRKQMGGLNLNAEFTTREQRMEAFLDQAEGALKSNDVTRGKKNLEAAERVIEELEKRLGR
jgi:serine/threonine-protein kinase